MILSTSYLQSYVRLGTEATEVDEVPACFLDVNHVIQQQHTQCDTTSGVWDGWGICSPLPLSLWGTTFF